jgi:hypothetical protein
VPSSADYYGSGNGVLLDMGWLAELYQGELGNLSMSKSGGKKIHCPRKDESEVCCDDGFKSSERKVAPSQNLCPYRGVPFLNGLVEEVL